MKNVNSENIVLLSADDAIVGDIIGLEYLHGKFDFSISPDFCGYPTRVPNKKNTDKVIFKIDQGININSLYKLKYKSGHILNIRIEKLVDDSLYADVIMNNK